MTRKLFWIFFFLILIISFAIRLYPTFGYNFYFTVDQGNNAVQVRDLIEKGVLPLKGPETGISGVFTGPLWYYFVAIGHKLFNGDPFGGLLMVILLNISATALVMWVLYKKISWKVSLLVGASLQAFWHYYDFSRYEFNPFPLIFLSFWQIFLLTGFLEGKKRNYVLAFIPLFLSFNSEVAGSVALLLFQGVVGLYAVYKKTFSLKEYLLKAVAISGILALPLLFLLYRQFVKSSLVSSDVSPERGYFSSTNFTEMLMNFSDIFEHSIIPQSLVASIFVLTIAVCFYLKAKKKLTFEKNFFFLVILLWVVSYLFFGSNHGWQDWHTIYLYPLTFVSIILLLTQIPRKFGAIFLAIILFSQLFLFKERYVEYLKPSNDYSMLYNRLDVIDWIYENREGQGFNVYTFTSHIYDYPSQYLFWWYGRKEYGFMPCEYSVEPGFLKHMYISGAEFYSQPTLGCETFRFAVIEPGNLQPKKVTALEKLRSDTILIEEKQVGGVTVEKRRVKREEEL